MTRDRLIGLALCASGIVCLLSAMQIRRVIPIGIAPGTFPMVLSVACCLLGSALLIRRTAAPGAPIEAPTARTLAALAAYGGLAVFTVWAFESVGFVVTGGVTLIVVGRMLGARWAVLLPAAVLAPLAIHALFQRAFAVPLPAGILAGMLP